MGFIYFKVKLIDIAGNHHILDHSTTNSLYEVRQTADLAYVLLKYPKNDVPQELFILNYLPMTHIEMKVELADAAWPQPAADP